jgi:hypothetical protein
MAALAGRFQKLVPNGLAERREHDAKPLPYADRRLMARKEETRSAQLNFKVTPTHRASFFRLAAGYGLSAIVFFEALRDFALQHETEFRAYLANRTKERR